MTFGLVRRPFWLMKTYRVRALCDTRLGRCVHLKASLLWCMTIIIVNWEPVSSRWVPGMVFLTFRITIWWRCYYWSHCPDRQQWHLGVKYCHPSTVAVELGAESRPVRAQSPHSLSGTGHFYESFTEYSICARNMSSMFPVPFCKSANRGTEGRDAAQGS
jgi:hypothetical protein